MNRSSSFDIRLEVIFTPIYNANIVTASNYLLCGTQEYMASMTSVSLESSAIFMLMWTSFQQSIVTEPIICILDVLLCGTGVPCDICSRFEMPVLKGRVFGWFGTAVNKETSVQKVCNATPECMLESVSPNMIITQLVYVRAAA